MSRDVARKFLKFIFRVWNRKCEYIGVCNFLQDTDSGVRGSQLLLWPVVQQTYRHVTAERQGGSPCGEE